MLNVSCVVAYVVVHVLHIQSCEHLIREHLQIDSAIKPLDKDGCMIWLFLEVGIFFFLVEWCIFYQHHW